MRSRDLVDAWKEYTDILERENVAIPTYSREGVLILPATVEWARSQKDRSVRLQQILEEKQLKEG